MIVMSKEPGVKITCLRFVRGTVLKMSQTSFLRCKNALVDKFIAFSVIPLEEIDQVTMAEKLCDFFEKAEIKNKTSFEKFVEEYFSRLDSIVAGRVAKAPQQKKNNMALLSIPRSRRYYERAQERRKSDLTITTLVDYSRIMMCLYTAIIEANGKEITNFDFAASSLEVDRIISTMQEEPETGPRNLTKKKKFDTKDPYGYDSITFIIAIIMLYKILDYNAEGGNEDE